MNFLHAYLTFGAYVCAFYTLVFLFWAVYRMATRPVKIVEKEVEKIVEVEKPIDFADWLRSLKPKQRRIAKILTTGETTKATARKCHVSPGRVSQLRRELMDNWREFIAEDQDAMVVAIA